MGWKDYLYAVLAGSIGVAGYLFAKWLYKRLKSGWWDWWIEKQEKEKLIKDLEEFLRDYEEQKEREK